jgi:hypothetical protein
MYRRFGRTCCLRLRYSSVLKNWAALSSESLVPVYQKTGVTSQTIIILELWVPFTATLWKKCNYNVRQQKMWIWLYHHQPRFFAPVFHLSLFPTSTWAGPRSAINSMVPSLHIRRGLSLRRPTGQHSSACGYNQYCLIQRRQPHTISHRQSIWSAIVVS